VKAALAKLTEQQFQAQVVALARIRGWLEYHTYDSRRSTPGFPDLVLVRPGRVVWAELKTDAGKLTAAQAAWLQALRDAGQEVHVWRPANWPEIEAALL
jgi:hypothetical protein